MNYLDEFNKAKQEDNEYENKFIPIIQELNKIHTILKQNFISFKDHTTYFDEKKKIKTWLFFTKEITVQSKREYKFSTPVFETLNITNKFLNDNHPYVQFSLDGKYLMSIGTEGEFKDKIYIMESYMFNENEINDIIYDNRSNCYYKSKKLTIVQFFAKFIKNYKKFLYTGKVGSGGSDIEVAF